MEYQGLIVHQTQLRDVVCNDSKDCFKKKLITKRIKADQGTLLVYVVVQTFLGFKKIISNQFYFCFPLYGNESEAKKNKHFQTY